MPWDADVKKREKGCQEAREHAAIMEEIIIKVNGKEYKVSIEETEEGRIKVYCGNDVYEVETKSESDIKNAIKSQSKEEIKEGELAIKAPLPGIIIEVSVKKGEKVKEGQLLAKLIAMKMENDVRAPKEGTVIEINSKKDSNVNRGDILMILK